MMYCTGWLVFTTLYIFCVCVCCGGLFPSQSQAGMMIMDIDETFLAAWASAYLLFFLIVGRPPK